MMRLPAFSYRYATSVKEAVSLVADNPTSTRFVAGGTDLYPNMKRRHQSAETVVSLRRIEDLFGVRGTGKTEMHIGAMTSLADITDDMDLRSAWPGLVRAVVTISTPVLRNMATIGGNLCLDTRCTYYNQSEEWRRAIGYCMKEVGEVCWVAPGSPRCWAVNSSDSAPLLCAIGARVRLVGSEGEREIPMVDLYNNDGIQYLTKRPDEVLTELTLPPVGTTRATYWKLRRRGTIDFPVLGVGAAVDLDGSGIVQSANIFLGGIHSYPAEAREAADSLVGKVLDEESVVKAGRLARDAASPMDNTDFTLQWRRQMVPGYVEGALRELGGLPPRVEPNVQGLFPLSV